MASVIDLFDPDVRLVAPGLSRIVDGREAVVGAYEDFIATATIDRFEITERSLLLRTDVAVATYCFDIGYRIEGAQHREQGKEVLVIVRSGGTWRAVWRAQTPAGESS
jgi:ketosteroid isomerase-like protein